MSASRKTHRILQELHRSRLDPRTRDHRADLEEALVRRHEELYGERPEATRPIRTNRFGWGLRLAAAGLGLVIVALAAGAISVDHEVPLGHEIVLELADASAAEIPSLPELLAASQRLSGATSVSVNVAESAERGGGSTVTVLLLGDSTGRADSASPADRLVEALRELYPQLAPATVSSRELIGVFPRSLGEILGRKLFAVELGADELAGIVKSVWGYQIEGRNWVGQEARVVSAGRWAARKLGLPLFG